MTDLRRGVSRMVNAQAATALSTWHHTAQQASEHNVLPMPLMPRKGAVRLPPPSECAAGRRVMSDVHEELNDEKELCWWR